MNINKNTKIIIAVVAVLLVLLIAAECDAENRLRDKNDGQTSALAETTVNVTDPPTESDSTPATEVKTPAET